MEKEMERPVTVGTVVYSRAGRDEGNYFMVAEIIDDGFVAIVDGDIRKLNAPKKKKIKHLLVTSDVLEDVAEKMRIGDKVCDAEVYKALRKYNS